MSTFTVSLPDSLKPLVEQQATSEGFQDPSAYIHSLILRAQKRAEVEAMLEVGFDEIDRGLGIEVTPEFWEQMRSEYRQRRGLR